MNKEEALKIRLPVVEMAIVNANIPEVKEALDMAIKALEQEPCEDATPEELKSVNDYIKRISKPTGVKFDFDEEQEQIDFVQPHRTVGKLISIDVLDKIRAEIELLSNANPSYWHSGDMVEREEVLDIIDKYKAENDDVPDNNVGEMEVSRNEQS